MNSLKKMLKGSTIVEHRYNTPPDNIDFLYITVMLSLSNFFYGLILYVPSTIFQLNRDRSSWVEPVGPQRSFIMEFYKGIGILQRN